MMQCHFTLESLRETIVYGVKRVRGVLRKAITQL